MLRRRQMLYSITQVIIWFRMYISLHGSFPHIVDLLMFTIGSTMPFHPLMPSSQSAMASWMYGANQSIPQAAFVMQTKDPPIGPLFTPASEHE